MFIRKSQSRIHWVAVVILTGLIASPAGAQEARYHFDISNLTLSQALRNYGQISGQEIIFTEDVVAGLNSISLQGDYTAQAALDRLLQGTGLIARRSSSGAVMIRRPGSAGALASKQGDDPDPPGDSSTDKQGKKSASDGFQVAQVDQGQNPGPVAKQSEESSEKKSVPLQEVVVTGTNIPGETPIGSRLEVFTQQDIEVSGALTLDQFFDKLSQNWSGGANPGNETFSTNLDARQNFGFGGSVNLRGLGVGTTLTLINGHRVAPSGANGSFVDVTMIPTSAVDRIEILTDGASAIYGSDAVGGVVNIILKKSYDGAETQLRYGTDTNGPDAWRASQAIGRQWSDGGGLISYEFQQQGPLLAAERTYADFPTTPPGAALVPGQKLNSVLASLHQDFGSRLETFIDTLWSDRRANGPYGDFAQVIIPNVADNKALDVSAGLRVAISDRWNASLSTTYSANDLTNNSGADVINQQPAFWGLFSERLYSADGLLSGPLFPASGGDAPIAVGADFRREASDVQQGTPGQSIPSSNNDRRVYSAFGEIHVPLLGEPNAVPGIRKLEISLAERYDHYSDFGGDSVPKFGLRYDPVAHVSVRASFGRSYVAPLLQELLSTGPVVYLVHFPNTVTPGSTELLREDTGNPGLSAETSRTWTTGLDLTPTAIPVHAHLTYFDIHFSNKIQTPAFSVLSMFDNPGEYGSFVMESPTPGFVNQQVTAANQVGQFLNATPFPLAQALAMVSVFANDTIANTAVVDERGLDLAIDSNLSVAGGRLDLSFSGTWLFDYEQAITPEAPLTSFLNQVQSPLRLKAHGIASWSRAGIGVTAAVNYTGSYANNLVTPTGSVASWTTADIQVRYDTTGRSLSRWLDKTMIALTVQNAFNASPPYVSNTGNINYDPANASPLGRFVSLEIRHEW